MEFNNTSDKNGLIQTFEFWTRLEDGEVSGNTTLLKQITGRINRGFDNIMPRLLSYSDFIRWDDTNHTDRPWGTINLVSGQNDYTTAEDDNSLDVLNLMRVRIYESSSATKYKDLERMYINDERVSNTLSPNPDISGIPTHFLEQGNTIFLYPEPNYSATNGIELYFEREQSYFDSSDTTKEPGIPKPFHELPVLYAALDYNFVNRPNDTNLLTALQNYIAQKEKALDDMISMRNPTPTRMSTFANNR